MRPYVPARSAEGRSDLASKRSKLQSTGQLPQLAASPCSQSECPTSVLSRHGMIKCTGASCARRGEVTACSIVSEITFNSSVIINVSSFNLCGRSISSPSEPGIHNRHHSAPRRMGLPVEYVTYLSALGKELPRSTLWLRGTLSVRKIAKSADRKGASGLASRGRSLQRKQRRHSHLHFDPQKMMLSLLAASPCRTWQS